MALIALPSPKVSSANSLKLARWYRFYAMFSDQFASGVLADAGLPAHALVLDPWVGVGTTTAAGARAGLRAFGVDINPVMAAISRGRCAPRHCAAEVLSQVARIAAECRMRLNDDDPLLLWFGPAAARAIRRWAEAIHRLCVGLDGPTTAGFMFTSVFEAAWKLAANYRSKNPTWVKEPMEDERVDASEGKVEQLIINAARAKMALCIPDVPANRPEIVVGTSKELGFADGSVDFVLTSPPYCTRIDYVTATRLELAILGHSATLLGELRDRTMGSSTIRDTVAQPVVAWGDACLRLLKSVAEHPSKGSASYYLKTYLQYFDDLYESLAEVSRCLRLGGRVVLVVQDSLYKGIHVDLARICEEVGRNLGWSLDARKDHIITRSMRCVNTRSRRYGGAAPTESVLWFSKG